MDELIQSALNAREHAHAPFSRFLVGAALEHQSGRIFTGCNIENATYGLTMCAERVALFKAISEGAKPKEFRRVVVATDVEQLTPPCGSCRQLLWELGGDLEVVLVNLTGKFTTYRLTDLFPKPFDESYL